MMRIFEQKPKASQQTNPAKYSKSGPALSGQSSDVHSMLQLQRKFGNQAVQKMLQSNPKELQTESATTASTRFGQDFTPNFSTCAAKQLQREEETRSTFTVASGSIQVPRGQGGNAGSINTDTFFVALPADLEISATAHYLGGSDNISDWSVQLFRRTLWGADEEKSPRRIGRVGQTITFSAHLDYDLTPDFYLRFRNASQYEPIRVDYSVTR